MSLAVTDVGAGPVVVLLHAFPVNRHLWDGVADQLASAGRRVIAPDLPGFGESSLPAEDPDLAVAARAVFDVLSQREVGYYTLAGLSMGGYVAMQMLRHGSSDVPPPAALALVDTKMGADPPAVRDNRLAVADRALAEGTTEFLVDAMIEPLLSPVTRADRPQVVAQVAQWIRETRPEAVAWGQRAMARRPDSRDVLSAYDGSVLVLAGADDVISPPDEQRGLVSVLQRGELRLVPHAGHLSAVEDPAAVADALLTWPSE